MAPGGEADLDDVLDRHLGPDLSGDAGVRRELDAILDLAGRARVEPGLAPPVTQAYVRAVGRIAEAEAEAARQVIRDAPPAERAELVDRLLAAALPNARRAFEALHATLLRPALAEALSPGRLSETNVAPGAIALVDLSGSTHHLATRPPGAAEEMVDALFEAGQAATLERPVRALKYVGDGFFLAGGEPRDVALAAFDALDHIARTLPLGVRAGLAYGPLLRRAGDYFGLPVNLAQLLTKAAPSGTVLATEAATDGLPEAMRGGRRSLRVRGIDEPLEVVSVRRTASQ